MIVDADCHISPTREGGNSVTAEELIAIMDRSGVDKAVIWLQPPYLRHLTSAANDYVAESARRFPDRFIPFGWADPNVGVDAAIREVQRGIEEHGFYGIKMNGAQNNFPIDHPELAMPVIEEIAKRGSILALHVGADAYDNTSPYRVATIAKAYPALRILAIHMGGVAHQHQHGPMLDIARQYPNITLIGSEAKSHAILQAIKTLGAERVCFGSDTPFEIMRVELAKYRALMEGEVSEEEQAMVLGGSICKVLGM